MSVVLKTAGTAFSGWKDVEVTRSIESLAGTFTFTATERYPGPLPQRKVLPGQSCTVELDGETVITGWVDIVSPSYDASSHSVDVRGRDRASDLVDCAALHAPGEWANQRLERLAGLLAEPFGVSVRTEVATGDAFRRFVLQKGETAFEAISRAARQRGVLVTSDGLGGLVITRAGTSRESVRLRTGGVPRILSARATYSDRDRFSEIHVRAQASGTDTFYGIQAAQVSAVARDPEVARYRPLLVLAEEQPGGSLVRDRALWEAASRAGQGARLSITVQGWKAGSRLWAPNRLVQVDDELLGVSRELLVISVSHRLSDPGGTTTTLELGRPEGFTVLPLPETGGPGSSLLDVDLDEDL